MENSEQNAYAEVRRRRRGVCITHENAAKLCLNPPELGEFDGNPGDFDETPGNPTKNIVFWQFSNVHDITAKAPEVTSNAPDRRSKAPENTRKAPENGPVKHPRKRLKHTTKG